VDVEAEDVGVVGAAETGAIRGESELLPAAATGPLKAAISREPTCRVPAKATTVIQKRNPAATT
jgi:hypothetical protein